MAVRYNVLTEKRTDRITVPIFALHHYLDTKSHLRDMVYHTSLVDLLFLLLNNEKRCIF